MGGLRNTKAKSGTKTPDFFFNLCFFVLFTLTFYFIELFFTVFIMTGVFQKEFRAQQNSYGHLITVLVSSGHFSHGGMQTTSELGYELYGCSEKEKKKRDLYILLSLLLFFRLLSMLCPPTDSWASCPSAERWLWSLWPSKGSSRAPNCWRTAYTVGVSAGEQRGPSLMSSVVIPLGVLGQPQTSHCRVWSAEVQILSFTGQLVDQ